MNSVGLKRGFLCRWFGHKWSEWNYVIGGAPGNWTGWYDRYCKRFCGVAKEWRR